MDIVTSEPDGSKCLIDIAVTHAVSSNADRLARAALVDGAAAAVEESQKRNKYKNAVGLTPFVVETGGRIGLAARSIARRMAPTTLQERSKAISGLWQTVAVVLQRHNGVMFS